MNHTAISRSQSVSYNNASIPVVTTKKKGGKEHHQVIPNNNKASPNKSSKILQTAENMIKEMPIQYLQSKPELRKYVIEIATTKLVKQFNKLLHKRLRKAFSIWKSPPVVHLNEKQFGVLLLCKVFSNILDHMVLKAFKRWAKQYSSKYNPLPLDAITLAAMTIQRWFRYLHSNKKRVITEWFRMVQVTLQRNKATKLFLLFERMRFQALMKIRLGISSRRRYYFGCRTIQRVWRWNKRRIRVTKRLTRAYHARLIQQWWHWIRAKSQLIWLITKVIVRAGGFYRVFARMPARHMARGYHDSILSCVSMIQKAWFSSVGKFAMYLRISASREKRAQELQVFHAASVIQNNFRAWAWKRYMKSLVIYNRARRLQRSIRAYRYRLAIANKIEIRRNRCARVIQSFYRRRKGIKHLNRLFEKRRLWNELRDTSQRLIAKVYRNHVVWVAYKRKRNKRYYDALRSKTVVLFRCAAFIQKNWRRWKGQFQHHVYVLMARLAMERHLLEVANATFIQQWYRRWIPVLCERKRLALMRLHRAKALMIQKLAKAFLLRNVIFYRMKATFEKRTRCRNVIVWNIRLRLWRSMMHIHFGIMMQRFITRRQIFAAASLIQRALVKKHREYNTPVRVAARIQLAKRRERERIEAIQRRERMAAITLQTYIRKCNQWKITLSKLDKLCRQFHRQRAQRRLRKGVVFVRAVVRFNMHLAARYARERAAARLAEETHALEVIAFYFRRHRELQLLRVRFELRKRVLAVVHALEQEKVDAEVARQEALEDMHRTEENMQKTIDASWKQGSDATGRNYYYNYVTGESRWTPPENWTIKPADQWVRNIDDRGNVYYYNIKTGKSRWLPPCATCGKQADKWCLDCGVSYCEKHFDALHNSPENEALKEHKWSLTELEKETLAPGEVHCVECRKRKAVDMCTTCWDPYCVECFKFVHKSGNLRKHKTIDYKRAKRGWMCVKAREEGEMDYYINGTTGETTFEKPPALMTPQEKLYYQNFVSHKEAAENYVHQIEKLQIDLEAAAYERDRILFESITKAPAAKADKTEGLIPSGGKSGKGGGAMFGGGDKSEYRKYLLEPSGRRRGKERSDYIKGLLESVVESRAGGKKDGNDTNGK